MPVIIVVVNIATPNMGRLLIRPRPFVMQSPTADLSITANAKSACRAYTTQIVISRCAARFGLVAELVRDTCLQLLAVGRPAI